MGGINGDFPHLKGDLKLPRIPGKMVEDMEFGMSKGLATKNREFTFFS